ncbi:MAG: hypothetical protein RR857_21025 [Comamonas sp.]
MAINSREGGKGNGLRRRQAAMARTGNNRDFYRLHGHPAGKDNSATLGKRGMPASPWATPTHK